jgi:quercetin dioxygenase-like cupin family protein
MQVHDLESLRTSPAACLFEGGRHGAGVALSVYVTTWRRGQGPSLHRHPYAEVFFVERGEAVFSVAGEERRVGAGHVAVVEPETPHRFHNDADEPLRVLSVHPSPEVVQVNLEG